MYRWDQTQYLCNDKLTKEFLILYTAGCNYCQCILGSEVGSIPTDGINELFTTLIQPLNRNSRNDFWMQKQVFGSKVDKIALETDFGEV